MARTVDIETFVELSASLAILDVRSPGEFASGHIPNALSLPLFTNEERAEVGTLYVQNGRQPAAMKGLEFFGTKMTKLVEEAKVFSPNMEVLCHCWRGGMRSAAVAWLLE